MNNILNKIGMVIISLIFSGSILAGVVAIFRYLDPDFSIGFFYLLAQFSLIAWMILLLTSAIVFVILTNLPVFVRGIRQKINLPASPPEQSD